MNSPPVGGAEVASVSAKSKKTTSTSTSPARENENLLGMEINADAQTGQPKLNLPYGVLLDWLDRRGATDEVKNALHVLSGVD